MKNNVLVLGNGFDLYHGMHTKYSEFVEFTKDYENAPEEIRDIYHNNTFIQYFQKVYDANKSWIDCEKEIEKVVYTMQKCIYEIEKDVLGNINIENSQMTAEDIFVLSCTTKYLRRQYPNWTYAFDEKYVEDHILNKDAFLKELRQELDEVMSALAYYLKKEQENLKDGIYKQIKEIQPNHVINFNYTNTYPQLYNDKAEVYYVHGDLSDKTSIVLGIPDVEKISLDFIYFKKYFQRIQKRRPVIREIQFDYKDGIDTIVPTVYFLGLSMGRTDEDIIKYLFDLTQEVKIFYYDQKDYETKIINLIEIYGRELIEQMLWTHKIEFILLDNKKA